MANITQVNDSATLRPIQVADATVARLPLNRRHRSSLGADERFVIDVGLLPPMTGAGNGAAEEFVNPRYKVQREQFAAVAARFSTGRFLILPTVFAVAFDVRVTSRMDEFQVDRKAHGDFAVTGFTGIIGVMMDCTDCSLVWEENALFINTEDYFEYGLNALSRHFKSALWIHRINGETWIDGEGLIDAFRVG